MFLQGGPRIGFAPTAPGPYGRPPVIRNIIFDWCGTLMDDMEAVWLATNHTLARAGVPALSLEAFRREFELPFRHFYERLTPHVTLTQLDIWYKRDFRSEMHRVRPLPHSLGFLRFCRERGIRMFVLSSIHPSHFQLHMEITRFAPFFTETFVGIEDKRKAIAGIVERYGMKWEDTLFVGDMRHDIESARAGNIVSCAVLTGFDSADELRDSAPDLTVDNLDQLREILEENQGSLPLPQPPRAARHPLATVGALVFDSQGRALMTRSRKWSHRWGIPGGKIRRGETAEEGLRREILEETGLEIENIRMAMVQDAIDPDEFHEPAHFLLLNYTATAASSGPVRLNQEAHDYRWAQLDEALGMDLNAPTRNLIERVRSEGPRSGQDPQSPDLIHLEDIEVHCRIGAEDAERAHPQRLLVRVILEASLDRAAASDRLSDTIDYARLVEDLRSFVQGRTWILLERLVHELCQRILLGFGGRKVTVEARKQVLHATRYVSVRRTLASGLGEAPAQLRLDLP